MTRLTLLLLAWLLSTQALAGPVDNVARWLVAQVDTALPGTITYGRLQASIRGPIIFEQLRYQEEGITRFSVQRFELDWSLAALLSKTAKIKLIQAEGVEIHFPPPAPDLPEAPSFTLPDIALPVSVDLQQVAISEIEIYPHAALEPIMIDNIALKAYSQDDTLILDHLQVRLPQGGGGLTGKITPVGDYPLSLALAWHFDDEQIGSLGGKGKISGDLQNLVVKHSIGGPVTARIDTTLRRILNEPSWSGDLKVAIADLGILSPELSGVSLNGALSSKGSLDDFRGQGQFNTTVLPGLGEMSAGFEINGSREAIHIDKLALSTAASPMALDVHGDVDITGQTVDVNGQWRALAWPLTGSAQVASPEGEFSLQGTLDDYHLRLFTQVNGPEFGTLKTSAKASGSKEKIKLEEVVINTPDGDMALSVQGGLDFADLAFSASGQWQSLTWPLIGAPQFGSPGGKFTASGTPKKYQAGLQATLALPDAPPLQAIIELDGDERLISLNKLSLVESDDGLALDISGQLTLGDLEFDVEGRWQRLAWPLTGTAQVESPQGRFLAAGSPDDYAFELDSQVQGSATVPSGQWHLAGKGSTEAVERLMISGELLEGEFTADLSARWQPQIRWQGKLGASGINPGTQWPDLPGKLKFATQSSGALVDGKLQATIELDELSGTLRKQEVKGEGKIALDGEALNIDRFELTAGSARLALSGSLDEQWAIDWNLAIADLAKLLPGASGRIESTGSLQGSRTTPRARLQLAIDQFAFGAERIERLQGEGTVDISGADRSRLAFEGRGLQLGGQRWQQFELQGGGTPGAHELTALIAGESGRISLALQGGLEGDNWQGKLQQLAARDTLLGDWQLEQPAAITASARRAQAGNACLASRPTRVCVQGSWDAERGAEGKVTLRELTPARFAQWLPPDLKIDTSLSGEASGSAKPNGTFQGKTNLTLAPGNMQFTVNGNPVPIELRGGSITGEANQDNAAGRLQLDLGELAELAADLKVQSLRSQPRLNGKVNAEVKTLKLLEKMAPRVKNVAGRISADLNLSGALPVPVITGDVRLIDAGANIPEVAIRIEDVQVSASGDGRGLLQLQGSARSGDGNLALSGQIDPTAPKIDLRITGERFQVINTADIQAQIAPDLTVAVANGNVRVDGQVTIPEANISPPELPESGVRVSDDVVIIDPSQENPDEVLARQRQNIYATVRVILGDAVRVALGGFNARLVGNLVIRQNPRLAPRATGKIGVKSGTYRVYGQELEIARGQILFAGGPIDNPGLNLRVERRTADFTAGVRVRGTLQQPTFDFFSIPAMAQRDILSALLIGSTAGGAGSTLTIGRYLAPGLWVSYGIGLFEAINTFSVNYELTRRLTLVTTSNANASGVDVFYTFER